MLPAGSPFRAVRGALLRACFVLCLGLAIAPAAAFADEAAPMYEPGSVAVIDLTLPQASIEALEDEDTWDEYQPGTFSLAFTDGSPDGVEPASAPMEIGIRLKGKFGSFRPLAGKAAFKLKLNFVKGKKFLGLKKMTLNNMVQDVSMIHEVLAYEVFRSVGVAAPRTGYADVRLNGEDYGLYLNVETFDDVSLERWFGPFDDPQHLYEGEYGSDVTPEGVDAFEVDEGDEDDRSDLEVLASAVAGQSAAFSERVSGFADLEQMTRMWAAEKYTGHWDGYAGTPGLPFPNNFYLYSSSFGEFQMLPWGTDQTWVERLKFDSGGGLMFNECLAESDCWTLYREALVEVGEAIEALDLDSLAQETAELLEPWQQLAPPREEHDLEEIEAGVEATRDFLAGRPGELADWLSEHLVYEPPEGEPKQPEGDPPVTPAPVPDPIGPSVAPPAPVGLLLGRSTVSGGVLTTRALLPVAGGLKQTATIDTAQGAIVACATRMNPPASGAMTLRCPLTETIRRRLYARWLKLDVETTFKPQAGSPEAVTRQITLRRTAPVRSQEAAALRDVLSP